MPSVLPALNEHIRRLARREVRAQTVRTKRASSQHRRDIAALKRLIRSLVTRLARVERGGPGGPALAVGSAPADNLRFRKDGLRTHRSKLGLSAKDYGRLVGVSALTVYHWEAGKSKPRAKQLASLARVRGMGKREALRMLTAK